MSAVVELGRLGKALNPIHIHLERRKVGIDFNWIRKGYWKKW
ncbi:hypothetical protein OHS18_12575 [Amycolatopsis sp. NBC_00355]